MLLQNPSAGFGTLTSRQVITPRIYHLSFPHTFQVIYAILYLCFVAYPLIYTDLRGWSLGNTGLAFLGIGGGTLIAILTEPLVRKMINGHDKDPETGVVPPEAAVSIICIGAFLIPIGQLWVCCTSHDCPPIYLTSRL